MKLIFEIYYKEFDALSQTTLWSKLGSQFGFRNIFLIPADIDEVHIREIRSGKVARIPPIIFIEKLHHGTSFIDFFNSKNITDDCNTSIFYITGYPESVDPYAQQSTWYRHLALCHALENRGIKCKYFLSSNIDAIINELRSDTPRACIFHRVSSNTASVKALNEIKAAGVKTILDIDDLVFDKQALESGGVFSSYTPIQKQNFSKSIELQQDFLSKVDLGFFSTPELVEPAKRINHNSLIIDNWVPNFYTSLCRNNSASLPTDKFCFFYGPGSLEHQIYFEPVLNSIKNFLVINKDALFILGGGLPVPPTLSEVSSQVLTVPRVSVENYMCIVKGVDLILAPLTSDLFSNAKSWIKPLEAQFTSTRWLCSKNPNYMRYLSRFGGGSVYPNERWLDGLTEELEHWKNNRSNKNIKSLAHDLLYSNRNELDDLEKLILH